MKIISAQATEIPDGPGADEACRKSAEELFRILYYEVNGDLPDRVIDLAGKWSTFWKTHPDPYGVGFEGFLAWERGDCPECGQKRRG